MRRITRAGVARRLQRYRVAVGTRIAGQRERRATCEGAANFDVWLARRRGRRTGTFPDGWRANPQIPVESPARIAVLMHVHFPDLVAELLSQLTVIPVEFDLIVTNSSGSDLELDLSGLPKLNAVVQLEVGNHGRDILPMLYVVNIGLLNPYELVLKVHTKKSQWREAHTELEGSGESWKKTFFDALLGSSDNVKTILSVYGERPDLGIVTAPGSVLGADFWGGDEPATRDLLRRLELDLDPATLRFAAGSMYWIRGFVLQGLRALDVTAEDFEPEAGQIDGTTAHAVERLIGIVANEAGLLVEERDSLDSLAMAQDSTTWRRYAVDASRAPRVRVIPFFLPQFHATPENDRWWGRGFTEWRNVTAASPVYRGHHQPRLPSDLGFYDLRLDTVRQDQIDLAKSFGIEGFMYYYYWFAGRRLLSMPIERLHAGTIEQPFCIMWANENWTRRWDGRQSDVLIGQRYDEVPATEFIDDVLEFLKDDRYLRVNGAAIIAVYRVGQIPDSQVVFDHWRRRAREEGVGELLLLNVDVATEFDGLDHDLSESGLNGSLAFPPHNIKWEWLSHIGLEVAPEFEGNILSYRAVVADAEQRLVTAPDNFFPGVMVTFDNTARRQWKSDVWYGSNPYTFRRWLALTARALSLRPREERLLFVNAWNEWAEGAVLEPTERQGKTFLLAVRDVVMS